MDYIFEHITETRERAWAWFSEHAHKKHALWWLGGIAFLDTIFFPIAPEALLAALVLAHPNRWKIYLPVALIPSILGATVGYFIMHFLFQQFGAPLIALYGLEGAFNNAKMLMNGSIFLTMMLASFTPLPDKAFIYAAGAFGAPFLPFITGFLIGRGLRMSLLVYLVARFGAPMIAVINRYLLWAALAVLVLFAGYVIVHFGLLPL